MNNALTRIKEAVPFATVCLAVLALFALPATGAAQVPEDDDSDDENRIIVETDSVFLVDVKKESSDPLVESQPGNRTFSFGSGTMAAGERLTTSELDGFLDFTSNEDDWQLEFCNNGINNGDDGAGNGLGSRGFTDFTENPESRSFLAVVDIGSIGGKNVSDAIIAEGPEAAANNPDYPSDIHNATNCSGNNSTFNGTPQGNNDGVWTAGGLNGPDAEANHEFIYVASYDIMDGNFGNDETTILWTIGPTS